MEAKFTTAKGSVIVVRLITERAEIVNLDGDKVEIRRKCLALEASINGQPEFSFKRVSNPEKGEGIAFGNSVAAIPTDKVAEVDAVFAEYRAKSSAAYADRLAADKAYRASAAEIAAH